MTAKRTSSKDRLVRVVDGHEIVFDRKTSERMRGIRQRDTAPEILVRQSFSTHGMKFRTQNRDLPGSPDLANRTRRWALFVHGCYWHRHAGCRRATTPKRNTAFWVAKFEANVARDARVRAELIDRGFEVLTIWECEAESAGLDAIVADFARKQSYTETAPRSTPKGSSRRSKIPRSQPRPS